MSAPPSSARARKSQPLVNANATPPSTWERDWRTDVTRQLDESAEKQAQTAVILERLSNRLDEHDRRINALETAPQQRRQDAYQRRGLTLNELYVLVTALGVLFAILSPHLGWH